MKRLSMLTFALLTVWLSLDAGAAWSQDLKTLTFVQMHPVIGVGEEVFLYAVPKHLDFFKSEGLDVKLQGAPSGTVAAQVIQTNGAQLGTTAPESIMQMREQGGDIVAFFGLKRNAGTFVVVMDDSPIQKLEDLKGKTIGANSFGSGGGYSLKQGLGEIGITSEQYTQITISPGPGAFAALQSGKIDAMVVWDSMLGVAENTGLKLRKINISFQDRLAGMAIAVNGGFVRTDPGAVGAYCRAMTKGLVFTKANPEAAISIFWDEFPTTRPANLDEATARKNAAHILDRFLEMALQGQPQNGELGDFIPAAWQNTYATFKNLGSLKGLGAATDAYTDRFLKVCNDFNSAAVLAQAGSYPK